jgi:hypothetical protein
MFRNVSKYNVGGVQATASKVQGPTNSRSNLSKSFEFL